MLVPRQVQPLYGSPFLPTLPVRACMRAPRPRCTLPPALGADSVPLHTLSHPCRYLAAIQLTSQHLLRYLAVAVVVNKRRRNVLNDLKRVVAQEAYEYK